MAATSLKFWKEKPPGPEQKELQRMFVDKEIDVTATADSGRKTNEMFQQFPARVFSSHFRKTKAKLGLCANVNEHEVDKVQIPELGASKIATTSTSQCITTFDDVSSTIQLENTPFSTWVYTDHKMKTDFVCVIVPTISGGQNINFELSEDGTKVIVNYTWPSVFYRAEELFNESIQNKEISSEHPKIHSFVSNWLDSGVTENSRPQGRITIDLPCKVKREI